MPRRRRVLLFQAVPITGEASPLTEARSPDLHRPAVEEGAVRGRAPTEASRTVVPVRPEEGGEAETAADTAARVAVVEITSCFHLLHFLRLI